MRMATDTGAAGAAAGGGSIGGGGTSGTGGAAGGEDDAATLIRFLEDLDADLQDMIGDLDFMEEALRVRAKVAYEAGGAPGIKAMIDLLRGSWDDHFDELERHGLTGDQLRFKMTVHGIARDRYVFFRGAPPRRIQVVVPGFSVEDQVPWADVAAKDYLDCSDIILESLSGALGGAGAAVIEIKKMIEWLKGAGWGWMRRMFNIR
jgi:hypothetical protein